MPSRKWLYALVGVVLGASSGCGLLCDRYCERQHERYGNACCAPAAAPAYYGGNACCAPAAGGYVAPVAQAHYCP